jgi:hypothetical protein
MTDTVAVLKSMTKTEMYSVSWMLLKWKIEWDFGKWISAEMLHASRISITRDKSAFYFFCLSK